MDKDKSTGSSKVGGYLTLLVATDYGDRIRAVLSDSGISNLVTFNENTAGWRRDLQRQEFGDERDPKTREFLERTAPVNNASKIKKPFFLIQGKNDPAARSARQRMRAQTPEQFHCGCERDRERLNILRHN